jgi:hypothetical protein
MDPAGIVDEGALSRFEAVPLDQRVVGEDEFVVVAREIYNSSGFNSRF